MFAQGVALHRQGRLREAAAIYEEILRRQPGHADALHLLGLVSLQSGQARGAVDLIERAVAANPRNPAAHYNLGHGLCLLARFQDAIASFDRALALKPDYAEAHNNRANALSALKRHAEAVAGFQRAVALRPDYAEAHNNLGITLHELKDHEGALASFDAAIRLRPDYAEACNNRGGVLEHLQRHAEALASFDRALALTPDYADAHYNRGNALHALKRHDEALASYDNAIALRPGHVEAHVNRGNALRAAKRRAEALASYERAIALNPSFAEAHANRGDVLYELERFAESALAYETAFRLDPSCKYAIGSALDARQHACAWRGAEPLKQAFRTMDPARRIVQPFAAQGLLDNPAQLLACAKAYGEAECPPRPPLAPLRPRPRRERIRLAYVSANFHDHAMMRVMAELFELHDRDAFEVVAVSIGPASGDAMRRRLEAAFDLFLDCRTDSETDIACSLMRHEIDIAVDLMGYTRDSRPEIFSYRPVPLQVNYLGFPGTMGVPYMDYILGDATVTPLDHQPFFAEKIVQLPESYQVNDRRRVIASGTPQRRDFGLPETGFVFCCFNNTYKITPEMFDLWMRLLQAVEGSVLWQFRGNPDVETNLRREAAARDVAPERLVFAPKLEFSQYLARTRCADLFLDTLPYNAHSTASDALWMGLPVLTCLGRAFQGRVGASLLRAVGLPELVTASLAEYEALALRLATDPALLAAIKAKLEINRLTAPLFDTDRFARHVERAYRMMHERHLRGLPPESFAVPVTE
jgi:predicted O-linked N-acetylglucosamine transferase (SPINDLY family)